MMKEQVENFIGVAEKQLLVSVVITGENSRLSLSIFDPNVTIDWIIIATDSFNNRIISCWSIVTYTFEYFTSIGIRIVF